MRYNSNCKGDKPMARKTFATPVEESIQNDFKIECKNQGYKQNEVIEALMAGFINGEIKIEKKISYKIIQREK
jgi:hypothetical protein